MDENIVPQAMFKKQKQTLHRTQDTPPPFMCDPPTTAAKTFSAYINIMEI
jgi:hypothetical protein